MGSMATKEESGMLTAQWDAWLFPVAAANGVRCKHGSILVQVSIFCSENTASMDPLI